MWWKKKNFKFNNVFHTHIRDCIDDETKIKITSKQYSQNLSLIKSRVKDTIHKNYDFRSYQYAIVWMMIALNKSSIKEVADIKCAMSLMNIRYLIVIVSNAAVLKMSAFINVRDIDNALHQSSFYVCSIYI